MNKIISILFLAGSAALNAQFLDIDFGSTFDQDPPNPALFFADMNGIRFDTDLPEGQTGIITVGHFDAIGSQATFADYLDDFTQVGLESTFVAGENGYLQASTSTTSPVSPGTKPYVFVFGGVSDFADAATATSFSIYSDTLWSDFPALNTHVVA